MSKRFVGLDISKHFHVAWTDGQKPLNLPHSKPGLRGLVKWLRDIDPASDLVFGLEPTGRYSETVRAWLVAWGFEVVLVPGAFVKRFKYLHTKSGIKTDETDARAIAALVSQGFHFQAHDTQLVYKELRYLSDAYFRLTNGIVRTKNRISALSDTIFPELSRHIDLSTLTARHILTKYSHPSEIAAAGWEYFRDDCKFVGRKISVERLRAIYDAACCSIGLVPTAASIEIQQQIQALSVQEQNRDEIAGNIQAWAECVDYSRRCLSLPGVSLVLFGLIIGQLGDLRGYPTPKHVYKAAGLNLIEFSSGQQKSRVVTAKTGKNRLRAQLFVAVLKCLATPGNSIEQWYSARSKHKSGRVLLVAASRKLLRMLWGCASADVSKVHHRIA